MDRMNPLDASFLYLEDGTTHMHIGSCAVFEGPPPPYEDLVRLFVAKLPLVSRYRQRVRFVPLDLGRPVWVDDPTFELSYHLRHTALPAPGDERDLERLMGRLMSQELDRARPLWEAWVVDGLEGGRWALVSKVHHCMVDGVAGVDLISLVLDAQRNSAPAVADDWCPEPEPSDLRLAFDAVAESRPEPARADAGRSHGAAGAAAGPAAGRRCRGRPAVVCVGLVADPADVARRLDRRPSPMDVRPGHARRRPHDPGRVRWNGERRGAGRHHGRLPRPDRGPGRGSVHPAAAHARAGLGPGRRRPRRHRQPGVGHPLRPPRAHRDPGGSPRRGPHPDDTAQGLARARRRRGSDRAGRCPPAGGHRPRYPHGRSAAHPGAAAQHEHGDDERPRSSRGRSTRPGGRCSSTAPFVPLGPGVRIGVAILSYNGRLAFGITGDFDTAADIGVVANGIEAELAELVRMAAVPATVGG